MKPLLVLPVLVLLGACSVGSPSSDRSVSPSAAPSSTSGTTACDEVRAGIDAFNQSDFTATVAYFRKAVPLAKAAAKKHHSTKADLLVEAVTYYAELAPEDYAASSLSSAAFAKYKAITLDDCETGQPTQPPSDAPTDPGVTT